ncbi:hypothetical protein [Alistipes putredinis]|uniref:hypothetical protein n=1 Tax=Alistipes putredinis TaxID=28117 RepID=UPI003AB29078
MEVYNNRLCITHDELTNGIMSGTLVKQLRFRGQIEQLQRGGNGREALFAVDSLPVKYKNEVYRRYPDLQERAASKEFIDEITPDGVAMNFYAEYKIDGTRGLDFTKQQEYANNAAILEAFRTRIDRANSQRMRVSKPRVKKSEFWAKAAKVLPRIADKFPHSLPENPRRLQEKFNEFFRGGKANYEVLISGKFQNANAAKVESDDQKAMLIKLLSDPRNLNDEQIVMIYNAVAERLGWKTITVRPVQVMREKCGLETAAGRLGATEFYNNRAMQVKRRRPALPLYMWSLDGWDVELYFQRTTTDKKGYTVTTYSNRLTVVVVLDPCTNYPIGYAIGEQENSALIKEAVRNAVNHTAELFGQRYRANQIQSDHYAMKAMFPIYAVAGDKVTPARVRNAKSKPVERYFKSLNEGYFQFFENWSGLGITSQKEKQPNSDALNAKRKRFPDEAGCRMQITNIIEAERAAKRADYLKLWAEVPENRRLPLSTEQYLLNFGAETGYKNALEGSGLNVKLLGARRSYDCFDLRFRQYAHIRWNVKYDPDNLDQVLAVSDDGALRFMLESKYVQPMALVERTEGDGAELARVQQFNTQLEGHIKGQLAIAGERVEQLFAHNPQLDNTLARALLCDSRGQHKDQRNARRLAGVNMKEIEVKTVEEIAPKPAKKESIFNLY